MLKFASLRALCGLTLATLALAVPAAAQAQSGYTIIDLGTLGGTSSSAYGINASGQVTGGSSLSGNTLSHVFRYSGGTMTDLDAVNGASSLGYGINASGQVTGGSSLSEGAAYHAIRWTETTAADLGTLGGTQSSGAAINASGQVAGTSFILHNSVEHAVRWTATAIADLGTLGGVGSEGYAINDSGQVAGQSFTTGGTAIHAFRYSGTTMTDLGTLGGPNSSGRSINNSGQVAGYADTSGFGYEHAVLWTGTRIADLGTLGGSSSYGYGINDSGQVVGEANTSSGSFYAFLYTGGRMIYLNSLLPPGSGWYLGTAQAINNSGWITGTGSINGQQHAYILKPNGVTVLGRIGLEGKADLDVGHFAAPVGTFHVSFRTPGSATEVYGVEVTLTTLPGNPFGVFLLSTPLVGTYDIAIKGTKNLQVVLPRVTVSGNMSLPDVTLPAGDANNDNRVDSTDFGLLVGSYGSDSNIPGSGYDPTCDFNFDGVVDATDFGLLVGNYGKVGAP